MITRSAALQRTRAFGLATAAAMLLTVGLAVVISWFPRAITATGSGLGPGIPGAYTTVADQEVAAGNDNLRPHGPNQIPKRVARRGHPIGAHAANQMPKR
jgi:hypothetical protein